MEFSLREAWTVAHGMIFGAVFLLASAGALADLYGLRQEWETSTGIRDQVRRLKVGTWTMAIIAWITVISGTWMVYIWYRAKPIPGLDLSLFPRAYLLSRPETQAWHHFGMEWKEHISWIIPFVLTAVAYTVSYYGENLARKPKIRKALLALLVISFTGGIVAGTLGALITKAGAIQ